MSGSGGTYLNDVWHLLVHVLRTTSHILAAFNYAFDDLSGDAHTLRLDGKQNTQDHPPPPNFRALDLCRFMVGGKVRWLVSVCCFAIKIRLGYSLKLSLFKMRAFSIKKTLTPTMTDSTTSVVGDLEREKG